MGKSLIISDVDFSTNGIGKSLDTVAYEGLSYRDIFETNNLLNITAGFEDGTFDGLKVVTGDPVVTDTIADSGIYSLKCFGDVSCQLNRRLGTLEAGNYYAAARIKCVRYVQGVAGIVFGSSFNDCINHTTSEFITIATNINSAERIGVFIGSFSSANLDCYIDTPICIDLSKFAEEPSKRMLTNLYNLYVRLKKK